MSSTLHPLFLNLNANFLPGYKESDDSEKVIMEPKLIAVQYLKSWFWLDILSSIPVDYIFLILDSGILDSEEVRRLFKINPMIKSYLNSC